MRSEIYRYKRTEQHFRVALFFSAASLAGAFGGILAYVRLDEPITRWWTDSEQGIAFMKGVGGLNGWRWIFILEGLLTILVSLGAYFFIPNYPLTAKFLSAEERSRVLERLATGDSTRSESFTWSGVLSALKDPKCWLYCLTFHTLSLPLYTLSLFLPTIITGLGFSAAQAQLLTIPPYAIATGATITGAVFSERTHRRAPFIVVPAALAVVGYIVLLSVPSTVSPGGAYAGTILAATGIYPATAIALSWPANNVSGQTKRATACAMQISIGNLGAVIGTQLYRTESTPRFFLGHGFALGYLVLNIIIVSITWFVLKRENAKKEKLLGERGGVEHGVGNKVVDADTEPWKGDADPEWKFQLWITLFSNSLDRTTDQKILSASRNLHDCFGWKLLMARISQALCWGAFQDHCYMTENL